MSTHLNQVNSRSLHLKLMCGLLIISASACQKREQTFDSIEWKRNTYHHDCTSRVRLMMLDALLSNYALVGMRRDKVLELLGPPDYKALDVDPIKESLAPDCKLFRYFLGPAGFGILYLHIEFDDGLVVRKVTEFND